MNSRELVRLWIEAFNQADADALADFYANDAVTHQVAEAPVHGRAAIRRKFAAELKSAKMVCILENIFEDRGVGESRMARSVGTSRLRLLSCGAGQDGSSAAIGTS